MHMCMYLCLHLYLYLCIYIYICIYIYLSISIYLYAHAVKVNKEISDIEVSGV